MAEDCAQLSRALLLPLAHSSLHPNLRESLRQELTEQRMHFHPLGKQGKG